MLSGGYIMLSHTRQDSDGAVITSPQGVAWTVGWPWTPSQDLRFISYRWMVTSSMLISSARPLVYTPPSGGRVKSESCQNHQLISLIRNQRQDKAMVIRRVLQKLCLAWVPRPLCGLLMVQWSQKPHRGCRPTPRLILIGDLRLDRPNVMLMAILQRVLVDLMNVFYNIAFEQGAFIMFADCCWSKGLMPKSWLLLVSRPKKRSRIQWK